MDQKTRSYSIKSLRVTIPEGKVAEKNPDRIATVHGDFFAIENGKASAEQLSFHSIDIDRVTWLSPVFNLDRNAGTLTLPSGERGRKANPGLDADAIDALLASRVAAVEEATATDQPATK